MATWTDPDTGVEYHYYYEGSRGPFLIPVSGGYSTMKDIHGNDISILPFRSTRQIIIEEAPSEDDHVYRRKDLTSGVITEITLGYGGTPYWKLEVDASTKDLKLSKIVAGTPVTPPEWTWTY